MACAAVHRFSGAKSSMEDRKSANPSASASSKPYFSSSTSRKGQNFRFRMCRKSPLRVKKSRLNFPAHAMRFDIFPTNSIISAR